MKKGLPTNCGSLVEVKNATPSVPASIAADSVPPTLKVQLNPGLTGSGAIVTSSCGGKGAVGQLVKVVTLL